MKVYLSELAEDKLTKLTHYLHSEWSLKVKKEFVSKLTDKINQIASHSESCPQSSIQKGLYKCVVTRQTSFYYRIKSELNEIEIITIFDTRQNPDKLKQDLK